VELLTDTGDRYQQGLALTVRASIHYKQGRHDDAIAYELFESIGDRNSDTVRRLLLKAHGVGPDAGQG
jgi:hypothetical protein